MARATASARDERRRADHAARRTATRDRRVREGLDRRQAAREAAIATIARVAWDRGPGRDELAKPELEAIAREAMRRTGSSRNSLAPRARRSRTCRARTATACRDLRDAAVVVDRQRRLARSRSARSLRRGRRRRRACSWPSPTSTRSSRRTRPIDAHARTNTTSVYTPRGDLPDAAAGALDRPHVAEQGEDRAAIVVDMTVDASGDAGRVGRLPGAASETRRSSPTTASPRGSTARARARRRWRACRGLDGSAAPARIAIATRCGAAATRKARSTSSAPSCGRSSTATGSRTCGRRRRTAPSELIENLMVAANGVTARFLTRARRRLDPPRREVARALAADRRPGGGARRDAARRAGRARAAAVPEPQRAADPDDVPDLSLARGQAAGPRRVRGRGAGGSRAAISRSPRGNYTHSTAPNRRFPDLVTQRLLKAAIAGPPAPYSLAELRRWPSTARSRRTRRTRSSG